MEKLVPKLRFPEFKENWDERKLSDVAKITTGSTPPTNESKFYNGEYLFVSPADLNSGRYVYDTKTKVTKLGFEKGRVIKKGGVLFVSIGSTIGKVGQASSDCITNQQINSLEAKNDFSNDFIYSLLFKNGENINKIAGVQAVPQLNKTDFSNLKYNFPTLTEQQKIASFLTSVDERLTLLAQQKEKLELYKKGVMQQIFAQKLRFKDENGENYPDWEEKKLGEICKLQGGFAFKSNEFKETGIPVIRISNISNHTNHIDLNSIVFYNKIEKDENFTIKKGDLIIAMSGATTGKSSIYNLEYYAYLNQRVGLFKSLTNKLEYNFLIQFVFSDLFKKQLDSLLVAGAQPNISSKDIESLSIPFPVTEEQQKIASFLSAIDVQIEGVSKKIEQTKLFKKGLLQQMFV